MREVDPTYKSGVIRLLSRIDTSGDGCWPWLHSVDREGYGVVTIRQRMWRAHRAIWSFFFGPLKDEEQVLHKCDNPRCCNPNHLFIGTNLDNIADMDAKGRRNCWGRLKICNKTAAFIRRTRHEILGIDLAPLLLVHKETIYRIRRMERG